VTSASQTMLVNITDRLFLGNGVAATALAEGWGVQAQLERAKTKDWSTDGGYNFWWTDAASSDARLKFKPAMGHITVGSDVINGDAGNDIVVGDFGMMLPNVVSGTATGAINGMRLFGVGEVGATTVSAFNYIYGFGPLGVLHQHNQPNGSARSAYKVDADIIRGGDGNDVLFGLLGDDEVHGDAGDDQVSGGGGYDRVSGGTGTNIIAFDRTRDTLVASGGRDVSRTQLDVGSTSATLLRTFANPLAGGIASAIRVGAAGLGTSGAWIGFADADRAVQKVTTKASTIRAVAMEPVSTRDVIRAVKDSEIVLKVENEGNMLARDYRVWLFDEEDGSLVPSLDDGEEDEWVPIGLDRLPRFMFDGDDWVVLPPK
jgi:Ca2+-binding RTX toxin-like protein